MVLTPPSKALWAAEMPRAAWSMATRWRHWPAMGRAPRGDGRTVMVLPGLFNSDANTWMLRRYLTRIGYRVEPWGMGKNFGAKTVGPAAEKLIARLRSIHAATGPITLIGFSLGGIVARMAAHEAPDLLAEIITVSAPYAGDGRATNIWRAFEWATGEKLDDPAFIARGERIAAPVPVKATALWSASDGLVNGRLCFGADCPAIEFRGSHMGMQKRPEVFLTLANLLGGRNDNAA